MWEECEPIDPLQVSLRAPTCNGCKTAQLKWELGDRLLMLEDENGWVTVYELDASPFPDQGEPFEHEGRPIRWIQAFMSTGHSDECYHWEGICGTDC